MISINLGQFVISVPELYADIYIAVLGALSYLLIRYMEDRLLDYHEWATRLVLGAIVGYLAQFLPGFGGLSTQLYAFVLGFAGPTALKLIINGSGVIKDAIVRPYLRKHR